MCYQAGGEHFIPLIEGVYTMQDLTDADEIFLTSAGLGVAIVSTFDFRTYSVAAGSVAATLREALVILPNFINLPFLSGGKG